MKSKNIRMRNDVTPYACPEKRVNEILFMLKDDPCYIILFRRKASHISNVLCLREEEIFVCMCFTANEDCILMKQLDYCQTANISFFVSLLCWVTLMYTWFEVNRKRNCHMTNTEAYYEERTCTKCFRQSIFHFSIVFLKDVT